MRNSGKYIARTLLFAAAVVMFACDGQKPKSDLPTSYIAAQIHKRTVVVGSEVRLGQGIYDNGLSDVIFQWKLKAMPDGSRSVLSDATAADPHFIADSAGTYILEMSASDGVNPIASRTIAVTALATPMVVPFDHGVNIEPCESCHDNVTATGKTANHMRTTALCGTCHTVVAWRPVVRVDHTQVIGSCGGCHNDTVALGKPAAHLVTKRDCILCHNTLGWLAPFPWPTSIPVSVFDHRGVVPGTCTNCHNGSNAADLSPGHIATSEQCDQCHHTFAWVPAWLANETSPIVLACDACHNGWLARGKSATHLVTSNNCAACHNTSNFMYIDVIDHAEVSGICIACHNNSMASGKPVTHPATTEQCQACHSVAGWRPVVRVDHAQVVEACATCHGKPPKHIKTARDCGSCHTTAGWKSRKKRKT